jgi:hypothetical protein
MNVRLKGAEETTVELPKATSCALSCAKIMPLTRASNKRRLDVRLDEAQ